MELSFFLEKAFKKHGNKYSYQEVDLTVGNSKVKIHCPIHGIFLQTPYQHFRSGCHKCSVDVRAKAKKYTNEIFLEKAIKLYGNNYDYSKVNIDGCDNKVEIICKLHGSFFQRPVAHLTGKGCTLCGYIKTSNLNLGLNNQERQLTSSDRTELLKKKLEEKSSYLFDFSLVDFEEYKRSKKVRVVCPDHGEFLKDVTRLISGGTCPECFRLRSSKFKKHQKDQNEHLKKVEEFKKLAVDKFGGTYDYSELNSINSHKKIDLLCKNHGMFKILPQRHILGFHCPKCQKEERLFLRNQEFIKKGLEIEEHIIKNFKTYDSFKQSPFYSRAYTYGIIDTIKRKLNYSPKGNKVKRIVYSFEFEDNCAYVGLTYNLERRNKDRFSGRGIFKDAVATHHKKTNQNFILKELTSYIPVEEAKVKEQEFIDYYRKTGWNILNRMKGGGIGGSEIKWTRESCMLEIKNYATRTAFARGSGSCYSAILINGWYDILSLLPNKNIRRKVINVNTGEIYLSVGDCAKSIDRSVDTLYKALSKKGNNKVGEMTFQYY